MDTAAGRTLSLQYLLPVSLAYLALPWVLFSAGWLRAPLALACCALVILPIARLFGAARSSAEGPSARPTPRNLALLSLIALLLLGISGVGGYGYQDTDWFKHNAILRDLVESSWPVQYRAAGGLLVPQVYYVAWYVPAALVGKLAGWDAANHALFAWSLAGLALALLWFWALNQKRTFSVWFVFVVFSGLDLVGRAAILPLVVRLQPQYAGLLVWHHIEAWAIGWQYSAVLTQLFWVPHQALAAWIACGALVHGIESGAARSHRLYICALTALWSPLVTLGLVPLLLADFLTEQGPISVKWRRYLSWPNLIGMLMLGLSALFYGAKLFEMPSRYQVSIPHGFSLSFAPNIGAKILGILVIAVFCLLEFGLFALLVHRQRRAWSRKDRGLFWALVAWLALLPLYRFGGANDLVMRASIPALFVLALFVSRAVHDPGFPSRARAVLIALLMIGSATTLIEAQRHVVGVLTAGRLVTIPDSGQIVDLAEPAADATQDLSWQYLGSAEAPFFRYLAREGPRQP